MRAANLRYARLLRLFVGVYIVGMKHAEMGIESHHASAIQAEALGRLTE